MELFYIFGQLDSWNIKLLRVVQVLIRTKLEGEMCFLLLDHEIHPRISTTSLALDEIYIYICVQYVLVSNYLRL